MPRRAGQMKRPRPFEIPSHKKPDIHEMCLDIDKSIYEAYQGPCMIPSLDSDGFMETNQMSRCHVIGQKFLDLIANQGRILTWPMNGHQLVKAILPATWTITDTIQPDFRYLRPYPTGTGTDSYPCTAPFACHDHDDRVFKAIDAPTTFDPRMREHQFLLAFRTIAGATSITEGALTRCTEEIRRLAPRRVRRQHGSKAVPQLKYLDQSMHVSQERADLLRPEVALWQGMYGAENPRQILSCCMLAKPRIRLAISSVTYEPGCLPMSVSVLPRVGSEPKDNLCDIIVTSRQPEGTVLAGVRSQEQVLEEQASRIREFLCSDPIDAIPALLNALSMNPTSYFFISPDDYRLLDAAGRTHIENQMASAASANLLPRDE